MSVEVSVDDRFVDISDGRALDAGELRQGAHFEREEETQGEPFRTGALSWHIRVDFERSDQREACRSVLRISGTFRVETLSGRLEPGASRLENTAKMTGPMHRDANEQLAAGLFRRYTVTVIAAQNS
jgi:hypothetical protein